ncbi:MAG: cobalamin B12-binding domain-containing protein [Candidatus Hydrogenedentes bacterium]|nr:cobalamin B12-binding domain-containing protein [Candidatus Hydrogenedentota bacterium]
MVHGEIYQLKNPVRMVTATSLFDGHDAAINIVRRLLQDTGAEVIHLGHNRSADEVVQAAIQEDAHAIAASCYQGGHVEFFKYIMELLEKNGAAHIQVFGGGGGVIVPKEIRLIESFGVDKIYSPEDGRTMGLQGMINHLLASVDKPYPLDGLWEQAAHLRRDNPLLVARYLTAVEMAKAKPDGLLERLLKPLAGRESRAPVLGVTGPGGAGKSSLVDELINRYLNDFPDKSVGILSIDPSRRKSGGALLGDRIRMNSLNRGRVYLRSIATRTARSEVPAALGECIAVLKAAAFDLVIVETAGIGQGDAAVTRFVDAALYVMTCEFGAQTQLEKIDMLDFADLVAINKFERKGAEDALRDVRKQYQRNHKRFDAGPDEMPVYGTMASRFNDDGVTALYHAILAKLREKTGADWKSALPAPAGRVSTKTTAIIPGQRVRYLAEIADTVREYHTHSQAQGRIAEQLWQLDEAIAALGADGREPLVKKRAELGTKLDPKCAEMLAEFPQLAAKYAEAEYVYRVRNREVRAPLYHASLAGTRVPRVALPTYRNPGELLEWLLRENVPGRFPYTAGVFPFKRADEDPTRMFAGEGDPARTNQRFKYLTQNAKAKRLSTAFDSVTLYGCDPDTRPDIYGKIGTSGVSICTLDDMKTLYDGFDLCAPDTSVSMTINGPAPMILAMFLNTAIDQQLAKFEEQNHRPPTLDEAQRIRETALESVRGTVQADILKEDQAQNTCIFAVDFALKMMGDVQHYFIERGVRNFYSVSISGYHIAEAGANPITQLAFTLANAFTYVEYYLSRGMKVDDFAPNLSFFFSNGMDPEYAVINRVARRIWAIAMRERYHANERSQMLKAHIQTSGRSLHAQEVQFNDIRTTLQALTALLDNCNSLHTNSYDEAVTTPTEESVRRALAIQLIIANEYGLYKNENVTQGSFIIEQLTQLVEEAVLEEFERLSQRGGVLGAMETGYQRAKIQDESHRYEARKASGQLPIIGVNTFLSPGKDHAAEMDRLELSRATEEEKESQCRRLREFHQRHADESPAALRHLKEVALSGGNIFAELMDTVRCCSLGQITNSLFEVGGQYRRST